MPNYQFRCPKCKKELEITLPINHTPIECKDCKIQMKKIMSPSTIIYKGSGFYSTEYPKGQTS